MKMIEEKFIYILDKDTMKELSEKGYRIVATFDKKNIYVFTNTDGIEEDLQGKTFYPSNTLTF